MKNISGNPYLKKEDKILYIDGFQLDKMLEYSNTPLMIFLESRIRDNIKTFKHLTESVFKNPRIFYSFKANYLYDICRIINSENIGAELISLPELKLARSIGFQHNKIIAGGPYLRNDFIEQLIINDVEEIVVYSIDDIKRINKIAKHYNKIQNLCLRISSKKYGTRLGTKMLDHNLNRIKLFQKKSTNIKLTTILSHYSTQMNNINQFTQNAEILADAFHKLTTLGINIKNINFGGGFPEATIMPQSQLKKIFTEIHHIFRDQNINYDKIYFEPGRFLVGDAGIFIAEIIKKTDDRWIFLNIGNNICPKFSKSSFRFYNASKIHKPHKYKTSIAGIIPTDQDVLAKNYFFNEDLEIGDKVLITNAGAYTLTFSNRFPYELPSIYLINGRKLDKIFDPKIDHDFSLKPYSS